MEKMERTTVGKTGEERKELGEDWGDFPTAISAKKSGSSSRSFFVFKTTLT
jgi:hypothetical protein